MKVVIIGSSGHAKVSIDILNRRGGHQIIGLLDDFRSVGESTMGIDVVGPVQMAETLKETGCSFFIAVGDNFGRHLVYSRLLEYRLSYINVIDPSAIISNDVQIGIGNFIGIGSIINAGSVIGNHCIINTAAQLDHDNKLQDFVSIAPGVTLAGNVTVEKGSSIGIGSSVIEKITIGRQTVIGAGSVVTRNIPRFKVAYGVPCIEKRDRNQSEIFL